jgi:PKD repeat protein
VHFTDTSLNTTEQFKIIEDTFCDEDTPAIIHGSENFLNCTYYKRMALVRANVTEDITNAKLHLYAVSTDSTSSIAVYNCSDAWSEATTSYNSAVWPLTTLDTISVSSANTWYAWDVSSNVSTARNYSLEIFDMADGKSSSFYSKEAVSGTYAGYIEGDLSGIEYSWDFGDGNTSTEKNPTHVYSTPGNYTVTHTVTKDSGQSSITKTSLVRVSNATISAIVAPYGPHSNLSQTPRYGGSSTGEYFICTGMATAFEQNCTLSRMKFYAGNTDHITDFRLNIWSTNETNKWYKFKSATPNIASLLTDGYNDLDISQYNINVNEGDHYGLYIKGDTANALAMVCAGPESNWWQDATRMLQSPSLVNEVDWGNVTGEVRTLSINFEATPPNFVVIGDSIMSGTPYSAAPVNQIEDAYYITREPWKVIPNKVSVATNKTFQNAAIAGDKYPNLHDRLALDVISKHPTQAVVEGGINNIIQGDSTATITAGIQAQIEDLQAAGIEPIVLTVLPVNNQTYSFSAAQYQQINDVNAWIISYHETNEDFRIVDARETLGTQDGNGYWIADSQYYDDGIHLSESGMTAVAQLVTNAINHTDGNLFKQAAQNIGTYFSKYFNTFYRFFFQISRRAY